MPYAKNEIQIIDENIFHRFGLLYSTLNANSHSASINAAISMSGKINLMFIFKIFINVNEFSNSVKFLKPRFFLLCRFEIVKAIAKAILQARISAMLCIQIWEMTSNTPNPPIYLFTAIIKDVSKNISYIMIK